MMERRKFLQNLGWIAGGLVLSPWLPASALGLKRKIIRGAVSSKAGGLAGVVVSDGFSAVLTDHRGRYELELHPDAVTLFISTPAGYAFPENRGIARHYRLVSDINPKRPVKFHLHKLDVDDNEHRFIIWADPQVKNQKDVEKMMSETVPDVQKLVQQAPAGSLFHGITVGDIVWDELKLFEDYSRAVAAMGIPFFQCLGNHDMDYNKGGDESSDDSFQQSFGPPYYSFNRGQVHYVVMDNVRYLGQDRNYDGYIQQQQLEWLKKDLSFVSPEKLLILCVHIPVHSGTKNKEALYEILKGRKVHIMSGHTHYHLNALSGDVYEHNHGTVCGAWWTGPICVDGTPNGYGVYQVKGKELSWHYQATGKPAGYQMQLYVQDYDEANRQIIANIWNYDPAWKTEYWIDGKNMGALEQFEGFDPQAYANLLGPDKPKPRGFAEPHKTSHLFKALVPAAAADIKVVATDRFGNRYEAVAGGKI